MRNMDLEINILSDDRREVPVWGIGYVLCPVSMFIQWQSQGWNLDTHTYRQIFIFMAAHSLLSWSSLVGVNFSPTKEMIKINFSPTKEVIKTV